jgi:5-methylcytosine-specific restriction endonuclease McrA
MRRSLKPCDSCGKPVQTHVTSPRCRECRRARSKSRRLSRCAWCDAAFVQVRADISCCSRRCGGLFRRGGRQDTAKGRRRDREAVAPGMSMHGRSRLLAAWRLADRRCEFCGDAVETVDHLIPLVRGGTNYEGNLAPACRKCNSAKADRTPIEFRYGARPGPSCHMPWMEDPRWVGIKVSQAKSAPRPKPLPPTRYCELCGGECQAKRRRYCSDACMWESNARQQRDAYRATHGLPVDATQPTRPRRRTWEVAPCQLEPAPVAA